MSRSKAAKLSAIERAGGEETEEMSCAAAAVAGNVVSGEIVRIDSDGLLSVTYSQNLYGALPARTLVNNVTVGSKVLLAFDGGDPTRPIVLGIIHDAVKPQERTLYLKGDRIVIEAGNELLLKCGEASIAANRDGKMHLMGKDVVSRAARTNKIRGAIVMIN